MLSPSQQNIPNKVVQIYCTFLQDFDWIFHINFSLKKNPTKPPKQTNKKTKMSKRQLAN